MKNVLMYNKNSIGDHIIDLQKSLWTYDYYNNQSSCQNRYNSKELDSISLIPFDYKGIAFNMITCPAGVGLDIDNWGFQEVKELFMLGETEVTQELFETVMGFNYSWIKCPKNPVETVTWFDCLEFCNRLSDYFNIGSRYVFERKDFGDSKYPLSIEDAKVTIIEWADGFRLPREWEWQVAAMAGTENQYAGTNDYGSRNKFAWFESNSGDRSHPVAQKLPNEWGFYDIGGNIWEWCENTKKADQNRELSASRVLRGGSWGSGNLSLNVTKQGSDSPKVHDNHNGFRIARSI
jgi:sulfatase modifying factor 1